MSDQSNTEVSIPAPHAARTAPAQLEFSRKAGGIQYGSMADAITTAEMMARSGVAVRQHLRGNPGACLAIVMVAVEWGMSPYLVAAKSYVVNDQVAYEAQLIQAVIQMRAPIKGRIKSEFTGEGAERRCRVWAELNDGTGDIVEYVSPEFVKIHPKNSPLWKSDPDLQHHYYSSRAFCRKNFPEVLLGIYAPDEIEISNADYTEVVQEPRQQLASRLDSIAQAGVKPTETVDPKTGEVTETKKIRAPRNSAADIATANLVIVDGIVFKNKDGAENVDATDEQYDAADLVYLDGKIKVDRRPKPAPAAQAQPEKASEPVKQPEPVQAAKPAQTPAEALADLGDDLDQPEPAKPARDPVWDRLDAFKADCLTMTTEAEIEKMKARFKSDFPGVKKGEDIFNEAQKAFSEGSARVRAQGAPAATQQQAAAPAADATAAGESDEDRLERMVSYDLDHSPRGIDMGDIEQVESYIKGVKAGHIGRPESTCPANLSEAGASAWKTGHAYAVENPKKEG